MLANQLGLHTVVNGKQMLELPVPSGSQPLHVPVIALLHHLEGKGQTPLSTKS